MQIQHPLRAGRRTGFSLAELMVVIVIIGLLATVVVPNVVQRLFKGQTGKAKADIVQIESAVNAFTVDNNGRYPDSLERLVEKDENGLSYLDRDSVPLDPWGNEYQYEPPGSGSASFRVFTLGADGTQGGDGKDRDFSNIDIKNGDV